MLFNTQEMILDEILIGIFLIILGVMATCVWAAIEKEYRLGKIIIKK